MSISCSLRRTVATPCTSNSTRSTRSWAFDVDKRQPLTSALRFIALGRDALAAPAGEEDNEPTGVYVSNGSTRKDQLLGTGKSLDEARAFFTMQHGQNDVFEILRKDMIIAKE